jgi:hypothetical protein
MFGNVLRIKGEQVFIEDLSVLCSVHHSFDPDQSPEKHCHSMMLSPPCFIVGMLPGLLQT